MAITLNNSLRMPIIGLGTWQASADIVEKSVAQALEIGYRSIDTAFNYGNEEAIGKALKTWLNAGGKREELFITTKLPNFGNRAEDVEKYISESLTRLGLEYVDLYLIHHPFGFLAPPPGTAPPELDLKTDFLSVWKAMEEQVAAGRARSIGLSNFNAAQIERISVQARIPPANLQVEMHAYLQQIELINACHRLGVSITAYAPLGSPHARSHFKTKYGIESPEGVNPLSDPRVLEIANRTGKTAAQILLKFLMLKNIAVVPKSSSPERILENYQALNVTLSNEDIATLNNLDRGEDGRIFDFLFYKGVETHPEYPFRRIPS